ncbi:hypothetical protein P170DRAFT_184391 [Aspergillus steynii IBT 23096]|uniref:Uncharacterized protein n=1 Tax=Aspergillus steynii IBT 23096 TaxID=1392250 RepID=A0A2I2G9A6_9EURO|nr:uncharacterized protein P170DRAFT_184391 [Aspergillus steynii IBT 23096]PLB49448.1 hypothetical protein P170DRAFT_184391 [Aspergillus steynii IBT 23096]
MFRPTGLGLMRILLSVFFIACCLWEDFCPPGFQVLFSFVILPLSSALVLPVLLLLRIFLFCLYQWARAEVPWHSISSFAGW